MDAFILKIFEMSLSGGIMILAVLILRILWKKSTALPRTVLCFLWAAVGLRLVIPFFVSSPVGVVPSSLQSNTAKAISGIAGIGHILTGTGIILLLLSLKKPAKN